VKRFLWSCAALLALLPSPAGAQYWFGDEFRVNTYTTGSQSRPGVASDRKGNFVVVWSTDSGAAGPGVIGQRFDHLGVPQGGEFAVSTYTGSFGHAPAVAAAGDGRFVVVWHDSGQDGSSYGVFARRFDAAGVPQGPEFRVNTYTTNAQLVPDVTMDDAGNFVVVWQSYLQDGLGSGVFGQRYDAAGNPLGSEFMVHSATAGMYADQGAPAIASDHAGNFVVVWAYAYSIFGGGPTVQIAARRFNAAGVAQGDEFKVSTTYSRNGSPDVARDVEGNFIVVWSVTGGGFPIPSSSLAARSFAADGTALNGGFEVTSSTGNTGSASVDADRNGEFVMTWSRTQSLFAGPDILAQRFDRFGTKLGVELPVNDFTTGSQSVPVVASAEDQNFVVVWQSRYQDGSEYGVFGQRFGDLIFRDGVEAGDFGRWSAAQTDGTDLDVTAAGAMAGTTEGIRALVDDTNPIFVQDDSPLAENRYRARFYFDPNGFDPGEANGRFRVRMFIAFDGSNRRLITLVLRRIGGNYSVMGRVRLSDGTRAQTPFVPISNDAHFIEFDWRRATTPDALNGVFRMQLDDDPTTLQNLFNLDNDASAVESARLGALTIKPGASGTLFYDQFESRRIQGIGP
jgi:hypothetical protein